MSDITPEKIREAAEIMWNTPSDAGEWPTAEHSIMFGRMRTWADNLEREQAEEARIDELAKVYAEGRHRSQPQWAPWSALSPAQRGDVRIGIQAVIEHLDSERLSTLSKATKAVHPRTWDCIEDVPDGVIVLDRYGDSWRRNGSVAEFDFGKGRYFTPYDDVNTEDFAPFTEVIADA